MQARNILLAATFLTSLLIAVPAFADPPGKPVPGPVSGAGIPLLALAVGYAMVRWQINRKRTERE